MAENAARYIAGKSQRGYDLRIFLIAHTPVGRDPAVRHEEAAALGDPK